jgi:hypothetical protein
MNINLFYDRRNEKWEDDIRYTKHRARHVIRKIIYVKKFNILGLEDREDLPHEVVYERVVAYHEEHDPSVSEPYCIFLLYNSIVK